MEQKLEEGKYDKLVKALGGFIGRSIGNILLGFLRALIQGFVLAYPLKWLWNDITEKTALSEVILLSYWTAFKIIVLFSFITKMSVTRKTSNEEVVEI